MKGGEAHIVAGVIDTWASQGINPHIILKEAQLDPNCIATKAKGRLNPGYLNLPFQLRQNERSCVLLEIIRMLFAYGSESRANHISLALIGMGEDPSRGQMAKVKVTEWYGWSYRMASKEQANAS